jgi:hypothetical protein
MPDWAKRALYEASGARSPESRQPPGDVTVCVWRPKFTNRTVVPGLT